MEGRVNPGKQLLGAQGRVSDVLLAGTAVVLSFWSVLGQSVLVCSSANHGKQQKQLYQVHLKYWFGC
jgi:hypothetical protein